MEFRIPERPTAGRALGQILTAAILLIVGSLVARTENPLVAVGILFITIIVLIVAGILVWFVVGTIRDRKHENLLYDRQSKGLCTTCEYDLAGFSGDLCPNCSMPVYRKPVFTPPTVDC